MQSRIYHRILVFLILLMPALGAAEYRAFELQIDNAVTNKSRLVISTLDHLQYAVYYPLNKGETIKYNDSWMCRENMSEFRKTCPKPERKPAALDATKSTTQKTGNSP